MTLPLTNDGLGWSSKAGRAGGRTSPTAPHRNWDVYNIVLSMLLMALGGALAALCSWDFYGPLKLQGQLVGAGNAALGVLGVVCCAGLPSLVRPSGAVAARSSCTAALRTGAGRASLRTALLVGLTWAALSTSTLLTQMSSEASIHCSLAESYVRISHLEKRVTALKHDDMLTQVFFRLNELDDMLDLVHEGAVGASEARALMHHAKLQDRDYVSQRISRLQKHAESVASALRQRALEVKANISHWRTPSSAQGADAGLSGWSQADPHTAPHTHTDSHFHTDSNHHDGHHRGASEHRHNGERQHGHHGEAGVDGVDGVNGVGASGLPLEPSVDAQRQAQEEALWMLEKRIEAVDGVVQYLDAKHTSGEMTYEEFEIILAALVDGGTAGVGGWAAGADVINVAALKRDQAELDRLKVAFERMTKQHYVDTASPHLEAVQRIGQKRGDARKAFEGRYMDTLNTHVPLHPVTYHETLIKELDTNMPQHCISEMQGIHIGRWIIFATLFVQASVAHACFTAVLHMASTKDD